MKLQIKFSKYSLLKFMTTCKKNDPRQALHFAFIIAGKGIAGLLNQVADNQVDDMAKTIHDMVDEVSKNIKTMQIKKS